MVSKKFPKKKAMKLLGITPSSKDHRWAITDHACRHCMGRRLTSVRPETGEPFSRCAECGAEEDGPHDNLCWCGVEMPGCGRVFECFRKHRETKFGRQEVMVRELPLDG